MSVIGRPSEEKVEEFAKIVSCWLLFLDLVMLLVLLSFLTPLSLAFGRVKDVILVSLCGLDEI